MCVVSFDDNLMECNISISLNNKTLIKIKSRDNYNIGTLYPCRTKPIAKKCYAEWRIGYEGSSGELKPIIKKFCSYGIFSNLSILKLKKEIEENNVFLDKKLKYGSKSVKSKTSIMGLEYSQVENIHSSFFLNKESYNGIYIELCQLKQAKVNGYQAFLHICIPINRLLVRNNLSPLVGRLAKGKEIVDFKFNNENVFILLDVIRMFSVINNEYKTDMIEILNQCIEQ